MALKPEEKEAVEFLTRFGGAITGSLEQLAFDWAYWNMPELRGTILYQRLHPKVPMNKDFIVGGLAVAPWVIGLLLEEDPLKVIPVADKAKAKEAGKTIQQFGEGGIFYSAPMLVRTTAVMNTPAAPVEARSRSTPPTGQPPARSRGRVIKL